MSARHVFIVGVDHRIQYLNADCGPEWTGDIKQFQRYLIAQGRERDIDLLAEEFSRERVSANHAGASTVEGAAGQLGVAHLFCDPDRHEREAQGIARSDQREAFWFERLRDSAHMRILFVCGDDHVDSFGQLLSENGLTAEVLSQWWGRGWQLRN
jgi:hypothetical protein